MELRVLKYFLAVAREESISGAANALHLSQPTLSRQLKDMEDELGKQLFIRGNKRIELTDEGRILKKRAEEIIALVEKTENEISVSDEHISGDVFIGAGETVGVRYLIKAAKRVRDSYPDIHFHIISGDRSDVVERLDSGLVDFGLVFGSVDETKVRVDQNPKQRRMGCFNKKRQPACGKGNDRAEGSVRQAVDRLPSGGKNGDRQTSASPFRRQAEHRRDLQPAFQRRADGAGRFGLRAMHRERSSTRAQRRTDFQAADKRTHRRNARDLEKRQRVLQILTKVF